VEPLVRQPASRERPRPGGRHCQIVYALAAQEASKGRV
jgi:hypothetical protein